MDKSAHQIEQWDTCKIEVRLLSGSRLNGQHSNGHPLFWFHFVAVAQSHNKSYVAGRSEKASFPFSSNIQTAPQPVEHLHINFLTALIHELKQDGWEPAGQSGTQWWELKFKRKPRPENSIWNRLKHILN
ncbi:MAG: hypothetical protein AAF902_23655 [Chloroflexota bacterium]